MEIKVCETLEFQDLSWHSSCNIGKKMKSSKNKVSCAFDRVGFVPRKREQVVFNVPAFCLGVSMNNM